MQLPPQSNSGTPSRATPPRGERRAVIICSFSLRVSLPIRSFTRSGMGLEGSQNGYPDVSGVLQARGIVAARAWTPEPRRTTKGKSGASIR
jgi:hypothetical protein